MEWISVKDRVPDKYQDVLVYLTRGEIDVRYRLGEEYPDDPDVYNRYVWSDQGVANDISFWMPLPKPPETPQKSINGADLYDPMANCEIKPGWPVK